MSLSRLIFESFELVVDKVSLRWVVVSMMQLMLRLRW